MQRPSQGNRVKRPCTSITAGTREVTEKEKLLGFFSVPSAPLWWVFLVSPDCAERLSAARFSCLAAPLAL